MSDYQGDLDERMMRLALLEAEGCLDSGDVPVGAVVARDGEMLTAAGNARERVAGPHRARRSAGAAGGEQPLGLLAAGRLHALRHVGAVRDVRRRHACSPGSTAWCSGPRDPKAGFGGSLGNLLQDERLNHRVDVTVGLLEDECGELLRAFFRERRQG